MSTIDINRLSASLQSSKIKERNDALNLLEVISVSKFRLSLKQFKILQQAILKLIEYEAQVFHNNRSNPVEVRLSKAAYYLRSITEKSIEDVRTNVKYKTYIDLCLDIISKFYIQQDLLDPCAIDFSKTIAISINIQYVKEHLNKRDWLLIYRFLLDSLENILHETDNAIALSGQNEKLFTDMFNSLQILLQCDKSISVNYLQLYDDTENYYRLLSIFDKTIHLFKKESLVIIMLFRIANKLIMTMSTIDFRFVNKLIKFGIRVMIFFYQTQWEKLQEQFLIFLNLPATHRLLHLHNLPKLIGGNRDILSDLIDSDEDDDELKSKENRQTDDSRDEVLLYNIRVLIQYLITRSMNSEFELKPDQIGLLHNWDNAHGWFELRSIYLKSQDYKPWLLLRGIAKLMASYFELKRILQQTSNDPNISVGSFSILGQPASNKRQKLGVIGDSLIQSNNVLDFCNRLIHSKSASDETQSLGLKLMIFHFEAYQPRMEKKKPNQSSSSLFSESKTASYENGDNTLIDANQTTFDFLVSNRDECDIDRNILFKNILGTFDNNKLSFWSVLTARSMINDEIRFEAHEPIKPSYIAPILKLAFLLIKQKDTCPIACNLIFLILYHRSLTTKLNQLVDDSILTQLETLIDLLEINGPYHICHESFQFWYAMNKLSIEVNLSKKDLLSQRIQDWVLAKWEISFVNNINDELVCCRLEDFILWLSGNSIVYKVVDRAYERYESGINEVINFIANYQDLEDFLLLLKVSNANIHGQEVSIPSISKSNNLEMLLSRMVSTIYNNEDSNWKNFLQWLLLTLSISQVLRPAAVFNETVKQLDYQFTIGMESLGQLNLTDDDVIQLIKIINKYIPAHFQVSQVARDSFIANFPYQQILDMVKVENLEAANRKTIRSNKNNAFEGLDKEFAEVRESSTPPSSGTSDCLGTITQLTYIRNRAVEVLEFISTLDNVMNVEKKNQLIHMIEYAESLSNENLLLALLRILDKNLIDEDIESSSMIRLIRLLGERLLSDEEIERSEFVLVVTSRLLSSIVPSLVNSSDASLSKDCYDICNWLIQCGTKELILTEFSLIEYCTFLINFLIYNDEKVISNHDLRSNLFAKFAKSTNNIKFHLTEAFVKLLQASPANKQAMIYNELFQRFADPQQSVETGGTYAIFFTKLSQASSQILYSSIFNLLECSRFPFFIPYLEVCLAQFCEIMKLDNPQDLFKSMKFEILRCWWQYDAIHQFPFALFGYLDIQSFYRDNYRELVSVALSTKVSRNGRKSIGEFIDQLANLRHSDSKTLVRESLSLIVPLAYTKEGIRNEIFDIILDYLQESLKSEFKNKLSMLVLEIIKVTDISKESNLRDSFAGNELAALLVSDDASLVIEKPGELMISFHASVELLRKLVLKYSNSEAEFWSAKQVYFLLRRVSILFNYTYAEDQKILLLRKFKFILIMTGKAVINFEICRLIVDLVCPFLKIERMAPDVVLILLYLKNLYYHQYDLDRSVTLVVKLMESLFLLTKCGTEFYQLTDYLNHFISKIDGRQSLLDILTCANDRLQGRQISLTSLDVENCLSELHEGVEEMIVLRLISRLFDHVELLNHRGNNRDIVELFLRVKRTDLTSFSRTFKLWISDYLSRFYLNGGVGESIEGFNIREYKGIPIDHFDDGIKNFDFAFRKVMEYTSSDDAEAAACAESILGVLIGMFNGNKRDILKDLTFKPIYNEHVDSILVIDFHTCVLLNDRLNVDYLGDSLGDLIDNFGQLLHSELNIWTTRLYLAILQELVPYSNVARLLITFVINVPNFAQDVLPELICLYLALKKQAGEGKVVSLLTEFLNSKKSDSATSRIFIRVISLLRIGAKKGMSSFSTVSRKVDLLSYYNLAAENRLFKTAMMLFEDAIDWDDTQKSLMDNYDTLKRVYESIDDKDLLYGLPEKTTLEYAISMTYSLGHSSEQLEYSCGAFDTDVVLEGECKNTDILKSMSATGLLGLSRLVKKSMDVSSNDLRPYEWCWKLSKWDLPATGRSCDENEVIYNTMKQIHDYPLQAEDSCQTALLNILDKHPSGFDDNLSVKEFKENGISWLKTMAVVHSVSDVFLFKGENISDLLVPFNNSTSWLEEAEIGLSENILLARKAAFQLLNEEPQASKFPKESLWIGVLNTLVRYNNITRICGQLQKMISSTMLIDRICSSKFAGSSEQIKHAVKNLSLFQTAQTLWTQGKSGVPVLILKELYNAIGGSVHLLEVDKCLVRAMMIIWMCESREELSSSIMEKYVLPTAEMALLIEDLDRQSKVFRLLAHFCELQYKSHTLDEQIDKLSKRVTGKKKEIEEIKAHYGKASATDEEKVAAKKYYAKLKTQYMLEDKDLNSLVRSRETFSNKAVEYYLRSILVNDYVEEDLDKFFALWLEQSTNEQLNAHIHNEILALASYKFISWGTQLVSRLTKDSSEFQIILKELILRMSIDHPHHVLYLLISLRKHRKTAEKQANAGLIHKCMEADVIWDELLSANYSFVESTLVPVERFSEECIQLAEFKPRGKTINIEKLSTAKYWLNELPPIPPPTMILPVDHTLKYNKIATLERIEPKISVATSGLSLPKIATFILSDGSEHRMLLKHGTDDLRQDSIMQQVFNKVNNIFFRDKECKIRNLRIRTYNAIPLGPRSGIIEFVPNSHALIDILKPYHELHDQLGFSEAREKMKNCQSQDKSVRVREYLKICTKVKPVLRVFFEQNFLTADRWFESRIKYTHGVGTTSIVGYMLGLGDRHCNNILLDKHSGEPIHIDFGVAFDQGKNLAVPETVPFRLTRDMVDGFGVSGVEGVFKKSCENTFRVLRDNKDHIISILDVLRWDPLYSWTLSPIRKKRLQTEETTIGILTEEDGSEAGRAILLVSDKLTAGGLSVEAAVRELVQEATSPNNLAMIYFGWSPFY